MYSDLMIHDLQYHIKYSMSWLKRQYRRLGLKRRTSDPAEETVKALLEVSLLCTVECQCRDPICSSIKTGTQPSIYIHTVYSCLVIAFLSFCHMFISLHSSLVISYGEGSMPFCFP